MRRLIAITIGVLALTLGVLLWAFPGARAYVWGPSWLEMDAARHWLVVRGTGVTLVLVVAGAVTMRLYLLLTSPRGVRPRGMGGANAIVQLAFLVLYIPLSVVLPMIWPWWLMMAVSYGVAACIAALLNPYVLTELTTDGTIRPIRTTRRLTACLIAAATGCALHLSLPAWEPVQWSY